MDKAERKKARGYNIVALGLSGAIVAAAAAAFVLNMGKLQRPSPGAELKDALAEHLPGTAPEVTRTDAVLMIELNVDFDPTVDAERTFDAIGRAKGIAESQAMEGVNAVKIELHGVSTEGRATSMSQEFEYHPSP